VANPILLSEITTPDKAAELFTGRRPSESEVNRKFYEGDHYQDSAGYMGQLPPKGLRFYAETLAEIKAGFVSENVIKEVVDRHVAGVLGREPLWGFLPSDTPSQNMTRRRKLFTRLFSLVSPAKSTAPGQSTDNTAQEADDAATLWWDQRRPRNTLKEALAGSLLEDKVVIRFFFPPAARNEQGEISAKDLASGMMIPRLEILTSDKAGIFVDSDTEEEFGVYVYKKKVGNEERSACELTFIDNGLTILRTIVDKEEPQDSVWDLGGRLLMYEFRRDVLVTEQIRSSQRALNLDLTSMMRNVNLAGNLERTVANAERPKKVIRVADNSTAGSHEEIVDAEYETGPGASMFLAGLLIRNDAGEIIGRASPNVTFRQPVEVKTFVDTRSELREAILGASQQLHVLISGDATPSGKSREESRGEFKTSLMLSKEVVDDSGRWMLETGVRIGAQLCGQTKKFMGLRCEFNAIIDLGPVTSNDRTENRSDVKAGLMSEETAMSRNGIEDTDAELERIQKESAERAKNAPPIPPKDPSQTGEQPPLIG